jgi:hypothetical protein
MHALTLQVSRMYVPAEPHLGVYHTGSIAGVSQRLDERCSCLHRVGVLAAGVYLPFPR